MSIKENRNIILLVLNVDCIQMKIKNKTKMYLKQQQSKPTKCSIFIKFCHNTDARFFIKLKSN